MEAAKDLVKQQLWRRGEISWKLDANQLQMYQQTMNCKTSARFVWNCARRIGKSYALAVIMVETALKNPGGRINYAAPTGKQARDCLNPAISLITADAPADCKPEFEQQASQWTFPNGAYIVMAGCEDVKKADRLRGSAAVLNVVDEAGFIPGLKYVLASILNPQTMSTGGQTLLASTPPLSVGHEFVDIARSAEKNGNYLHRTINDCPRYTAQRVAAYIEDEASLLGLTASEFKETTTYAREWLAEFVSEQTRAVIPEWRHKCGDVVKEFERPEFYDTYESLDIGFRDGSGVVFGYLDYFTKRFHVEDEVLLHRQTTRQLADAIRAKEAQLWPQGKRVYKRIADGAGNGKQVIADLHAEHNLGFVPTKKDDLKELMVDRLRRMISTNQLIIHPRCVTLIRQLRDTVWNEQRTSYERNADGHGDVLDSLIYIVRNIDYDRNPIPPGHGFDAYNNYNPNGSPGTSNSNNALLQFFGKKK